MPGTGGEDGGKKDISIAEGETTPEEGGLSHRKSNSWHWQSPPLGKRGGGGSRSWQGERKMRGRGRENGQIIRFFPIPNLMPRGKTNPKKGLKAHHLTVRKNNKCTIGRGINSNNFGKMRERTHGEGERIIFFLSPKGKEKKYLALREGRS